MELFLISMTPVPVIAPKIVDGLLVETTILPSFSIKGFVKVSPWRVNVVPGAIKKAMLMVAVSLLVSAPGVPVLPVSLIDSVSVALGDGGLVVSI